MINVELGTQSIPLTLSNKIPHGVTLSFKVVKEIDDKEYINLDIDDYCIGKRFVYLNDLYFNLKPGPDYRYFIYIDNELIDTGRLRQKN
jgi:hypothetical protein